MRHTHLPRVEPGWPSQVRLATTLETAQSPPDSGRLSHKQQWLLPPQEIVTGRWKPAAPTEGFFSSEPITKGEMSDNKTRREAPKRGRNRHTHHQRGPPRGEPTGGRERSQSVFTRGSSGEGTHTPLATECTCPIKRGGQLCLNTDLGSTVHPVTAPGRQRWPAEETVTAPPYAAAHPSPAHDPPTTRAPLPAQRTGSPPETLPRVGSTAQTTWRAGERKEGALSPSTHNKHRLASQNTALMGYRCATSPSRPWAPGAGFGKHWPPSPPAPLGAPHRLDTGTDVRTEHDVAYVQMRSVEERASHCCRLYGGARGEIN